MEVGDAELRVLQCFLGSLLCSYRDAGRSSAVLWDLLFSNTC